MTRLILVAIAVALLYALAMCRAAGRPMPLPDDPAKRRAMRAQIEQEGYHV